MNYQICLAKNAFFSSRTVVRVEVFTDPGCGPVLSQLDAAVDYTAARVLIDVSLEPQRKVFRADIRRSCKKTPLLGSVSHVCPEPVLVNDHFYI